MGKRESQASSHKLIGGWIVGMHHRHSLNTRAEHLGGDAKKLLQSDLCFALFIQQELLASHSKDTPSLSGDCYPERT